MRIDSSSAFAKAMIVTAVALLLLLPLHLLRNLVAERAQMREQAIQQVARGWGGRQLVGGPVLAIPVSATDLEGRGHTREWNVLPSSIEIRADITVQDERRSLGVYEVPVYIAKLAISGELDIAREIARLEESNPTVKVHLERARLLLPIGDLRGLRDVRWSEDAITSEAFEPARGFLVPALAAPVRADVDWATGRRGFALTIELAGTESLGLLPLAKSVSARVSGNWGHPGFARGFLPVERAVRPDRFEARWRVLDLNRSFGGAWLQGEIAALDLHNSSFGVDLVQPVDLYQRAERAVKYAGLFIGLTLLTLFMWEHAARRPVHPVQYGLVGLALSVFYLLLLALAEHVGFAIAYVSAAAALCALLGIYLASAFRSRASGATAGGAFAAIYALLYLLVTSESYSLLAGALALFGLLAGVMLLTRKRDWYASDESGAGSSDTEAV